MHVVRADKDRGAWGSIGRSRDEGLHGREMTYRGPRELAWSYWDPYVDLTGRIRGYAVADLREMGSYDWRWSDRNVWKVERMLLEYPHSPLTMSDARYTRLRRRYVAFRAAHAGKKPVRYYKGRERWTPLPPDDEWER